MKKQLPFWLGFTIIILAAVIAGLVAYWSFANRAKSLEGESFMTIVTPVTNTAINQPSVISNTASLAPAVIATSISSVTTTTIGSTNVETITIHSDLDVDAPRQDEIYKLEIAEGHYLFWPETDTNQLFYDGMQVYGNSTGTFDEFNGIALSDNGLHYAYAIAPDEYSDEDYLYVDGQLVANDTNIFGLSVTDDGKHYFYSRSGASVGFHGGNLIENGKSIFTAQDGWGIQGFLTNNDGSQYFLQENATGNSEWADVLNGKQVFDGSPLAQPLYSFSSNFEHYGIILGDESVATGTWTLSIDGKVVKTEIGSNVALDALTVTNLGHYAFTDENGDNVWVDNVPHHYTDGDGVGHGALISDDGRHYLIESGGDATVWDLDGHPIQIGNIQNDFAEFVGDTLYLYKVVK